MANTRFQAVPALLAAVLCCLFPFIPSTAFGVRFDVTPSISLDQSYDSNVFNTSWDEKDDFILRAAPAVSFSLRMPETTLNLTSSFTATRYFKYTDQNNTFAAIFLGVDATPIRVSPYLSFTPSVYFVQSRDSYTRSQTVPKGDSLVPSSIASESGTLKNRDYGGSLRVGYLVTPNVDFSIGGGLIKRHFLDKVPVLDNVFGGLDSQVVTGETLIKYKFAPDLFYGLLFSASRSTFENGNGSRTYTGGLNCSYAWTPAVSILAYAGASRGQETGNAGASDHPTWWPSGMLTFSYAKKDTDTKATLGVSINQSGGGSFGFPTRTQSVDLSFSDQIAPRWWADISGSLQQTRSLDAEKTQDMISAIGTAGIRHQIREWAAARLSGNAFRQWSNGTVGTDMNHYSAFFSVTLSHNYNIF